MAADYEDLLGGSPAAPDATVTVPAGASGEMALGAFEGADRLNSTIALWSPPVQSADLDTLPEKSIIDARSRDMLRNDAYSQGAASLHKDNIIGAHLIGNARPMSRTVLGKQDDTWEEEFQEEVEEKWELYADSSDHWIDACRTNNLTSLSRLAVGTYLMYGEMLATAPYITDDGSPFSTAIQMIDPDRLSNPDDRVTPWIQMPDQRGGVKYNKRGAPLSYFIRSEHPSDYGPTPFELPHWEEVKLRKATGRLQVIHLFEQLRIEQSRGVSEMAASLKAMKLTHTLQDIQVQKLLAQSLYAAAITSNAPDEATIFAQLGGGQITAEAMQRAFQARNDGYLSAVAGFAGTARGTQLDGVKTPRLYPGEKLELLSTGMDGALGTEFEQSLLRYIAASFGVSYEQLSRDYTHTNYSSARAAMNETWKFMQSRKKLIVDRFASIAYRLWLEEAINKNALSTFPKRVAPMLYTGGRLNFKFEALSKIDWIGASRGQIDEYKETQAAVLRIESGLSTAEDELARLGKDWRKVYRQLRREQQLRESLGLMFTGTDPQVLAAQAAAVATHDQDTAE